MDWTSHPEPKRKTDQYPGGNLPSPEEFWRLLEPKHTKNEIARSDGVNAPEKSYRAALNGVQYTNEISCLRGELRRAIIKLAEDMRAADNINILPTKRHLMQDQAKREFWLKILGRRLISEIKGGQKIWRLKS